MKALVRLRFSLRNLVILTTIMVLIACADPQFNQTTKASPKALLTQVYTLNGARVIQRPTNPPNFPSQKHGQDYLLFLSPTTVVGGGQFLYILDSGRRQIYQYDQTQQAMFLFADLPTANISSISVASDLSMYVADTVSHSILHFSREGKLLQRFSNPRELAHPVTVIGNVESSQVIVADSLYNQIVVFSSLGRLLSVIRTPQTRSIIAMAQGPDGLYLIDRLSRKVVVLGTDGMERYIFGHDTLMDPVAIAVDSYNRVFISDNFDNTLKVYEKGRWRETFGGTGATPGLFNRGMSLWLERDMLYVTDSVNGRIQIFRIAPPK